MLRRREPSVVLAFIAFDSSSLRLLSSAAVWRILSMPPADSKGYAWRRLMPSGKALLSSHARNGDGGPSSNKFSSAQRLGACRTVFPRLGYSQRERRGVIIAWHTEKVAPLHGLAYLYRYQVEPQVWLMTFALSWGKRTTHPTQTGRTEVAACA